MDRDLITPPALGLALATFWIELWLFVSWPLRKLGVKTIDPVWAERIGARADEIDAQ